MAAENLKKSSLTQANSAMGTAQIMPILLAQIMPAQVKPGALSKMAGNPWVQSVGEAASNLPLTGGNRLFVHVTKEFRDRTHATTAGFILEWAMKLGLEHALDYTYFASFSSSHLREDQVVTVLNEIQQKFNREEK